ncbi:MAG: LamG domain-containing protein, partial [Candidatus Roizmanbacteria bacterium]
EVRKSDYQITGSMSVGAWIKTATTGKRIISKYDPSLNSFDFSIGVWTTDHKINFNVAGSHVAVGATTVDNNAWHFVTGVVSGTDVYVYVDGVLDGSTTTTVPQDNLQPINIGLSPANSTGFFNGSIDEPFVTTEVLTAAQIFEMYNSGRN